MRPEIPQYKIKTTEEEALVRALAEALHFLTIESTKAARYANAERVENATSVINIALMNYDDEIARLRKEDNAAMMQFSRKQNLRVIK